MSNGSKAKASSSLVMRVVCSPPPTTTVAGVGGIVEVLRVILTCHMCSV